MGSLIGWLSGLRVRLALLVVVVGLPVLGLVVQGGLEQRRRAAEAVERHALTLAQVAAQLQRHAIKHSRDVLRLLAAQPAIGVESPGACERYLDRFHDENPSFANFGVIDTDGGLVCSALAFEPPLDLTDRDYFQRALRHQGFAAGSYQVGRVTHVPSINFGYPVTRGDGVVGVVFAAVPLTWLTQLAQEARLPAGTSARLVDAAGDLLVAHPRRRDGAGWEGSELQTTLLARVGAPGAGDGTFQAVGPDGTRSLYAVTTLQPAPHADQMLYLLVGLPRTQAFAEVDRITVTNIAYITLVLLLATGLALWASGGLIVDPVRRLVEVTQRLAGGDLGARATPAQGRGELAELARSFDGMAEALEQRTQQAERLNRIYRVLSAINGAIVRSRRRQELLEEACRIAVELGELPLAWVVLRDGETGEVGPAAHHAHEEIMSRERIAHYLSTGMAPEEGLSGEALAHDRVVVSNALTADPRMARWHDDAHACGFAAAIALPLRVGGRVLGTLNLFAAEADFFDEAELRLLEELAADVGLGMDHIDKGQRLDYLTNYDTVTGLPAETLLKDRLRQAVTRARAHERPAALLTLRLQDLADVTAAHGAAARDELLRMAGRRLAATLRPGDTVARTATSEFSIVLSELERPEDITLVTDRIFEAFREPFALGEAEVGIAVIIGIAVAPADTDDAAALRQYATTALESLKSARRSGYRFFSQELHEHTTDRLVIERNLHRAMEREELHLHYQPMVEARSERVIGAEALLRWHSGELGLVSPGRFIPVAEDTELIVHIGEWVLAEACRQVRAWAEAGVELDHVSVNVSLVQLRQREFLETVIRVVDDWRVDPRRIRLAVEITESQLMDHVERSVEVLDGLRALGLPVYVDDFGTGYSSLAYLKRLPIDGLKIDRSFVREVTSETDDLTILRAIVALAHSLGVPVTAEGVERREQAQILRELGCDTFQGFLFARPGPPEDLVALLEAGAHSRS